MFPNRLAVIACAAVLMLLLSACPAEPEPPPAIVASVTLLNLQPQPIQTGIDKQSVNNCGGTDDATYTVAKEREITHLLEVGSEFSVSADGAVKVFGTGIGLGTAVAAKVGATYGKRDTVARTIEITVDPKTMVEYEVSLQDVYQVGEAEVTVGGQRTTIPFRFFDDFVLVLLGTRELPCPGTPTAVPTFTAAPEGGSTLAAAAASTSKPTETQIPLSPTDTPTVLPSPTIAKQPTNTPLPSVAALLNNTLGLGTWFCLPERLDAVAVKSIPSGYVVQYPVQDLEVMGLHYYAGDIMNTNSPATAWLARAISLEDCPNPIGKYNDVVVNAAAIDRLLGHGNWRCQADSDRAIAIFNVPEDFVVLEPLTRVDKNDVLYPYLASVPARGLATGWLWSDLDRAECP